MFDRFTEPARQSVVYAVEEAQSFGHRAVGTEHLLLGLLREDDGVAARALEALEITLDDTRAAVERLEGRGEAIEPRELPFGPDAKRTLEHALREALNLGHELIGTEHVLIALTRVPDGVAGMILGERELDDRLVRGVVAKLIVAPDRRHGTWEYRIVLLNDADALTPKMLADMGADRWELVTVFEGRAVFKRRA